MPDYDSALHDSHESDVIRWFRNLSDDERVAFIGELRMQFCLACGRELEGTCHCENDE